MNETTLEMVRRQAAARTELTAAWFPGEGADVETLQARLIADQLTRPGYRGHDADARAYVLNTYPSGLELLCACRARGLSTAA